MRYEMPVIGDQAIWEIWLTQHYLPAMSVADELGMFEALSAEALTTAELADKLSLNPFALDIHLSLVAALGLVERRAERWRATPVARTYLLPDGPFYWGHLFRSARTENALHAKLRDALKRGTIDTAGMSVEAWETGQLEIEQARGIAAFMHAHSLYPAIGAARSGAFDGVTSLLDVGGGSGVFAIAIAEQHPEVRTTVLDLRAMCEAAQHYIDQSDAADRVSTIAVDMFREPWPEGHDALFFSNVFHDWRPETCAELAAKAFAVLPSGGRIYLHEQLMRDTGDGPATTASFSMLMLLGTRGKQYSLPEFANILGSAGFGEPRALATAGFYSLVVAEKP